jgi:hypothetical protein
LGGLLARVGFVAALVVVGLIIRPFVTGNAGDLNVGDCFDPPVTEDNIVEDVQHRPCTDPHGAEVIFVADYDPKGGSYPTDADFNDFYDARCVPAFNTYTGLDYAVAEEYSLQAFRPTEDGWGDGDYEITCFAVKTDSSQMTGSIKAQ